MTDTIDMFVSSSDAAGNFSAFLECDDDIGYFYLNDDNAPEGKTIVGAIRLATPSHIVGKLVSIVWSSDEKYVGLVLGTSLVAAFFTGDASSYGGNFDKTSDVNFPEHVVLALGKKMNN